MGTNKPHAYPIDLGAGWTAVEASTGDALSAGEPDFVYQGDRLNLDDALRVGLLAHVARSRGHTQAGLAQHLGMHPQTIAGWYQGRSVPRGLYRQPLLNYLLG